MSVLSTLGNLGAFLFLATFLLLALTRWQLLLKVATQNIWVLILPLLAISSAFWSDYPDKSLRGGVQFLITVAAGVIAGSCIRPRVLISAAFCAFLCTAAVCLAIGLQDYISGNVHTIQSILGSKNQLAELGAYTVLTGLGIVLDPFQPRALRTLAAGGAIAGLFCVHAAQSAGTLVFIIPAAFTMFGLRALAFLPGQTRAAAAAVIVAAALTSGLAGLSLLKSESQVLEALGKDSTLTGRAELWADAQHYFSERPLLGVGYQAFWQVDNPRAVRLWLLNDVPAGAGFNFHNLYFNTAVELGLAGLVAIALLQLSAVFRLLRTLLGPISPRQIFAAGIFIYLLGISCVEVIQTYMFMAGAVLFYVSWCYLKPRWGQSK